MKDAFQQQHEGEDNDDYMLGPGGKRVLTPEATQRKLVTDRAAAEEVSPCLLSHSPPPFMPHTRHPITTLLSDSESQRC